MKNGESLDTLLSSTLVILPSQEYLDSLLFHKTKTKNHFEGG